MERLEHFHSGQLWSFSKSCHFSNISYFLEPFLPQNNSNVIACTVVFCRFLRILILDPKWRFCKGCSLCTVANYGHFRKAVIFRILDIFCSRFLHRTTIAWLWSRFLHVLGLLILDPNWLICKGYSPWIVANFGHFRKDVIFRMLAIFWRRIFHRTTLVWLYSLFCYVFGSFNFGRKVAILQRL